MPKKQSRRINSTGRVTIPSAMRKQAGLLPGVEVDVVLDGEIIRVVRADVAEAGRREALQAALDALAAVHDP